MSSVETLQFPNLRNHVSGWDLPGKLHGLHVIDGVFEERRDTSIPGRTIIGLSRVEGAAQTDAVWLIYTEDQVGSQFLRQFAQVASVPIVGFVHKWSERLLTTVLPNLGFLNEFSLQIDNASDQFATVNHTNDHNFSPLDAFSFLVDVKTTARDGVIFMKQNVDNNGYLIKQDGSGRIDVVFRKTSSTAIRVRTDSLTPRLDNGVWRQVLVTKASGSSAASTMTVYVDGVSETLNVIDDTLLSSNLTTTTLDLGFAADNTGLLTFDGNLDEAAIFNVELTASDATEIYNSNNGAIDLKNASANIKDNLVSWWRFGDGSFVAVPNIPDEQSGHTMVTEAGISNMDKDVRP